MDEVIERALITAKGLGATYADVRLIDRTTEDLTLTNGEVKAAKTRFSKGFGVRVIVDGAWGFFSSIKVTGDEGERAAKIAVEIAKASSKTKIEDAHLKDVEIYQDRVPQPVKLIRFQYLSTRKSLSCLNLINL